MEQYGVCGDRLPHYGRLQIHEVQQEVVRSAPNSIRYPRRSETRSVYLGSLSQPASPLTQARMHYPSSRLRLDQARPGPAVKRMPLKSGHARPMGHRGGASGGSKSVRTEGSAAGRRAADPRTGTPHRSVRKGRQLTNPVPADPNHQQDAGLGTIDHPALGARTDRLAGPRQAEAGHTPFRQHPTRVGANLCGTEKR